MKTITYLLYKKLRDLNFIFLILILSSQYALAQGTAPLDGELYAIEEVKDNCDSINVGVIIKGGSPPYSIVFLPDETIKVVEGPNILTTWKWKVPTGVSTWDEDMFYIVDSKGEEDTVKGDFEIKETSLSFCNTSIINEIKLDIPNGISKPYGQNCKISGVVQWGNNVNFPVLSGVILKNSEGDTLYTGFDVLNYPTGDFEIPEGEIPQEKYKNSKVTDIVYLEVLLFNSIVNGGFWSIPIYMFPNKAWVTPLAPYKDCSIASGNDFETWIFPEEDLSTREKCIGENQSIDIGVSATSTSSVSTSSNVGVSNVISSVLGVAYTDGYSISHSRTFKWDFSFCDMCKVGDPDDPKPCAPYVPTAKSASPLIEINYNQELINVEFMDCNGDTIKTTEVRKWQTLTEGFKCLFKVDCQTSCFNKETSTNIDLPDSLIGNPGFIFAKMKNGLAPFEYSWSVNKAIKEEVKGSSGGSARLDEFIDLPESGNVITDLEPGEYCVEITDSQCCTVDSCVTIDCVFNMEVVTEDTHCGSLLKTGSIALENVNGVEPIFYEWSPLGFNSPGLSNLGAGLYGVTATDANGCIFMKTIPISEISETQITANISHSRWCIEDGAIDLNIQGSGSDFTVQWDNGATTTGLSNLAHGTYCATIIDDGGCKTVKCFTVGVREPMQIVVETTPVCGNSLGEAHLIVSGGEAPYTYQWLGTSSTGPMATGLEAGSYIVIVKDASGCQRTKGVHIKQSPPMKVYSQHNIPCSGDNMYAEVTPDGGTAPYTYLWSNGSEMNYIYTNEAGLYYVDVMDAVGCSKRVEFDLSYTGELEVTTETTNKIKDCYNSTGSVELNTLYGKAPYKYTVEGIGFQLTTTSSVIENLEAGIYSVLCEDACGNTANSGFAIFIVENDNPFTLNFESSPSCDNLSMGTGTVNMEVEGAGPYQYSWSNGATTEDLSNVQKGVYYVTVTNSDGCEQWGNVTVGELPSEFDYSSNITNGCSESNLGSIELDMHTDGDFTYEWSNNENGPAIYNLSTGIYQVTITNEFGCRSINTFSIIEETIQDFEYEVDVIAYFNNQQDRDNALITFSSEIFDIYATITIVETGQTDWVHSNYPEKRVIEISDEFSHIELFHFTYESPDGCIYGGTFSGFPDCVKPYDDFDFDVKHIDGPQGDCGPGQKHSYKISDIEIGDNETYVIEVTMDPAYDNSEKDFRRIIEVENENPFYINDVPSGRVVFQRINYCKEFFEEKIHNNCCNEFSCDLISEGITENFGVGYIYNYPFVTLTVVKQCFDKCGIFESPTNTNIGSDFCSGVIVSGGAPNDLICWEGIITVESPDGSTKALITVVFDEAIDQYVVSSTPLGNLWEADSDGFHNFIIRYQGFPGYDDCTKEAPVEFFGENHTIESVHLQNAFDDDDLELPEAFANAYYRSMKCRACNDWGSNVYTYSDEECTNSIEAATFYFTPNSQNDPCNSGGTITIWDFDNAGNVTLQNVPVPTGASLGELPGISIPTHEYGISCNPFGMCLFDALDIYGFEMDQKIMAHYGFDCQETNDPSICDEGFTWVPSANDCLPNCNFDDDCESGNCVGGVCVDEIPEDTPCSDNCDCPQGFYCDGEICVPSFDDCSDEDGDCQCPGSLICVNGDCVFDSGGEPECSTELSCDPGQFCQFGQCVDCPTFAVDYCYEDSSCGDPLDCQLEIRVTSSLSVNATIEVYRNSNLTQTRTAQLSQTPQLFLEQVPLCPEMSGYHVEIILGTCDIAPIPNENLITCKNPLCFTGGDDDQSNSIINLNNNVGDKVIDMNHKNLLGLERDVENKSSNISIYPNPFKDVININYKTVVSDEIDIVISDIFGRQIQNDRRKVRSGENILDIKLDGEISSGVYYLSVTKMNGDKETFKILHIDN